MQRWRAARHLDASASDEHDATHAVTNTIARILTKP